MILSNTVTVARRGPGIRSVVVLLAAVAAVAASVGACRSAGAPIPDAGQSAQAGSGADLTQLDSIVGDARYVSLGEDSHGMPGVHRFVADAFRYLVARHGFRLFVFESAWGIEEGLQQFMHSDRTTIQGDEGLFLNAFNSPSTMELLIWIRDWNRAHPDDEIRIAGYQPEQPVTDFIALWTYMQSLPGFARSGLQERAAPCRAGSGQFRSNNEFLADTFKRRGAGKLTYSAVERADCLQALAAISAYLEEHRAELVAGSSADAFAEAGLRIISLETYVGLLTRIADEWARGEEVPLAEQIRLQGEAYSGGDRARDQIFATLMRTRYAGMKVFFWMHNWHAAEHASELNRDSGDLPTIPFGTVSLGERLARRYGDELVTIGNIVPCGSTCTEPAGSLEAPFAERFGNSVTFVDLRRPQSGQPTLPLSRPGMLYANHHKSGFDGVVLDRQFDALFYMPPELAGKVGRAGDQK